MPTVLITGLNGFVAVHTAVVFLSNGWNVRGTVRSTDKADKVRALPALEQYVEQGRVSIVIVKDLIKGDFSEALQGVDGIAHCASPWHFSGKAWEQYRDPAVEGTTNVIEQAAKVDSVKSIAQMSSFAAIGDFSKPSNEQKDKVYTEKDWLPTSEEDAKNAKGDSAPQLWYVASKKFAEQAAVATEERLHSKHTLGRVCPPMVFGPAIHYTKASGEELANADVSTSMLHASLAGGREGKIPPTDFPLWGDVRDVAQALYTIVDKKVGGRFAICNGQFDYQLLANRAGELFPDLAKAGVIPVGNPGETPSTQGVYSLDGSKAEKELGIKYTTLDGMISDTVLQMRKIGAIKA